MPLDACALALALAYMCHNHRFTFYYLVFKIRLIPIKFFLLYLAVKRCLKKVTHNSLINIFCSHVNYAQLGLIISSALTSVSPLHPSSSAEPLGHVVTAVC